MTSTELGPLSGWKVTAASALGLPVFGYLHLALRSMSLRARGLSAPSASARPQLLYTWHQNIYLMYMLARLHAELREMVWLTHDRWRALWGSLPPTNWGMPVFVFRFGGADSRLRQIAEAFPRARRLVMFPDSGGPYFALKPGIVRLARLVDAELIPVGLDASRRIEIGRHARHRLPLPGAELHYRFGSPIDLRDRESGDSGAAAADMALCRDALAEVSAAADQDAARGRQAQRAQEKG